MVKFAYTAAVLQTQNAVSGLNVQDPMVEIEDSMVETLVQRACLPFLRRAAMLVFLSALDFNGYSCLGCRT